MNFKAKKFADKEFADDKWAYAQFLYFFVAEEKSQQDKELEKAHNVKKSFSDVVLLHDVTHKKQHFRFLLLCASCNQSQADQIW